MASVIRMLADARNAISARQGGVHDRPLAEGETKDASMFASRLCSQQIDGLGLAILLEPPATVTDLRLIALAGIDRLQDLEREDVSPSDRIAVVEHLTAALEHIAIHPALDGETAQGTEAIALKVCRQHANARALSRPEDR